MPRREKGLQIIAVEMYFAEADHVGRLGPVRLKLRITQPLGVKPREVESVEYNSRGQSGGWRGVRDPRL
jgi:hypothetical protein